MKEAKASVYSAVESERSDAVLRHAYDLFDIPNTADMGSLPFVGVPRSNLIGAAGEKAASPIASGGGDPAEAGSRRDSEVKAVQEQLALVQKQQAQLEAAILHQNTLARVASSLTAPLPPPPPPHSPSSASHNHNYRESGYSTQFFPLQHNNNVSPAMSPPHAISPPPTHPHFTHPDPLSATPL